MRLSSILNLSLIATGAAASARVLRRRDAWEKSNRRAFIVLDYDDALSVATRAGMPLGGFLKQAARHGVTHLSLPELTLNRLMAKGRITVTVPASPVMSSGDGGSGWRYLASAEPALLEHVALELAARAPTSQPQLLTGEAAPTLAVSGDLPTLAEMGLGFEATAAAVILESGLGLVPRPVSFAWPEARLVERTLAQAAGLSNAGPGPRIVAFEGDLILGHEMHLDATVAALVRFGLSYAYFSETRHQKGDWFIAKRLAPAGQVILSHYFTPAAMVPEDFHSAAHHWGMLARARSIRLCYINVFRRIHATDPLECLHYIEHIREELEGLGLTFGASNTPVLDAPDRQTQALVALAPAGAASLAASEVLGLDGPAALGLTLLAAAGAAALPYLDRPRGRLEHDYPPSYAPKLLALAGAAAAPAAAALSGNLAVAAVIQAGTGVSLAALTTGQDYQQRIETFRALNLDWALPLAAVLMRRTRGRTRLLGLGAVGAAWLVVRTRTPDLLGELDLDLPAGHTHHLSAAQRMIGDAIISLGPRPGRKWAGLGLLGLAAASLLERLGQKNAADAAAIAATLATSLMLAAFRQPARPLAQTLEGVRKSWQRFAPVAVGLSGVGNLMIEGPADDSSQGAIYGA